MNPATTATIINQGMGNPLVSGGIPDYMRVIQDQTAKQPEPKKKKKKK